MDEHRFVVLVVHRRGGKTVMSVNRLINAATAATVRPNARFGYIAPLLKQAKMVAWDILKQYCEPIRAAGLCTYNESELRVDFWNGSRIRLFGADNPDSIRGAYFDGVVLDEVAQMPPELWTEVVRPMLADRKGWAVFIGTPKGINLFSERYEFAVSGQDKDWAGVLLTVYDTDALDPEEIEATRGSVSERAFRQEFMCDFGAANDEVLITLDIVRNAQKRVIPALDSLVGVPRIMGVDVARFGGDRSVIAKRQGPLLPYPMIFEGLDNMELADQVARQWIAWEPDAVMIDGGRGEGVIDRLRQLGFSPVEVHSAGRAQNEHYANKRAEMWDRMREWVDKEAVLPQGKDLIIDMCGLEYSFNKSNRMQLERKEDLKKRGMPSPDLADAIALTHAFDVGSSLVQIRRHASDHGLPLTFNTTTDMAKTDYDVFAEM